MHSFAPEALDADHADPASKHPPFRGRPCDLSNSQVWQMLGYDAFEKELAKCQPLCIRCHRSKSFADATNAKNAENANKANTVGKVSTAGIADRVRTTIRVK